MAKQRCPATVRGVIIRLESSSGVPEWDVATIHILKRAKLMKLPRQLLLLAMILCIAPSFAVASDLQFVLHNLHFDQFDVGGFAPSGITHAIHKDQRGRIWVGTEAGLFLYDGNEVRSFLHKPNATTGLPNSFIKAIAESPDGKIWIGTWGGGLAYFDEASRTVHKAAYSQMKSSEAELDFDSRVWSMAIDRRGHVWIGSFTSGLFRYNPATGILRHAFGMATGEDGRGNRIDAVAIDSKDRVWFSPYRNGVRVIDPDSFQPAVSLDSLSDKRVADLDELPDGRMLITTWHGLEIASSDGRSVLRIDVTPDTSNERIMQALVYSERAILLGTAGGNLWQIDLPTGKSVRIPVGKHPGVVEPSIIWDMKLGKDGDILVGGTTGLWIAPAISRQFWSISGFEDGRPLFLTETRAIFFDRGGHLYLNSGTMLYRLAFNGRLSRPQYLPGESFIDTAGSRPIWLEQSQDKRLWIGTDNTVLSVDTNTKSTNIATDAFGVHTILRERSTGELFVDAKHVLLDVADPAFHRKTEVAAATVSRNGKLTANHLSQGEHGDVWVGTFSGLERFDFETRKPIDAFTKDASKSDWADPYVTFVHSVSKNEVLIGTFEGIWRAKLDETGAIRQLERILKESPFSLSSFDALVRKPDGTLIFIGEPGFVEYDHSTGRTRSLSMDEGLPTYEVYSAGFHQWEDLVILSGQFGPLLFHPSKLNLETPSRGLVITDITSFRNNENLTWPVHSDTLRFRHNDQVIRFKFGLLDYLNPMNDRYAIKLVGFQEDWLQIGSLKEFSFTNLDAGQYQLEVRVTEGLTGKDGTASIPFEVLPPWWQTWWAYTLYVLVIFGSLFLYWLSLQRKIVREKEISARLREADRIKSHFLNELESKVEDATRDLRHAVEALEIKNVELGATQQRAIDASRLKSEFLANMSHEIRTPMNGVLGFTQLLQKSDLDNDQRDYVETIDKSAKSLLGIINDVLDVSKIEAGKLIIDSSGFDLRECIADTLEALAPVAYEKNLELIAHVDESLPDGLRADPTRLRQILTNLVGNAIKFTDSGHIYVHVEKTVAEQGQNLRISVTDTGRGITAEDRDNLFQAFERGSVNLAGRYTGTGLGLVITKKLCEAMGGHVELNSAPGQGTSVVLELPLVVDRNPENRYGFGKPLAGRKVLVVDPHALSRAALRARLAHWGAEVTALADLVAPALDDIELVVFGIERVRLGDTQGLNALCSRLPEGLPRICFAATVDRDALRSLAESCNATCISKIGHLESQVRRISETLGVRVDGRRVEESSSARLDGLHVLIADDNRINRYFLKKILELHGASVTEVDSGTGVLQTLDNLSGSCGIDIALLDVHMPDIDGLEVARRIRAGGNTQLPLLAVSANVQAETYEAAITAGINDYLLKPVDEARLVDAVLEWTGREETV